MYPSCQEDKGHSLKSSSATALNSKHLLATATTWCLLQLQPVCYNRMTLQLHPAAAAATGVLQPHESAAAPRCYSCTMLLQLQHVCYIRIRLLQLHPVNDLTLQAVVLP